MMHHCVLVLRLAAWTGACCTPCMSPLGVLAAPLTRTFLVAPLTVLPCHAYASLPSAPPPPVCSHRIVALIARDAPFLACNDYASNVVEACLEYGKGHRCSAVVQSLLCVHVSGHVVPPVHAQAAHVIQWCMQRSLRDRRSRPALLAQLELVGPIDHLTAQLLSLADDSHGNFVLQTALEHASTAQHECVRAILAPCIPFLARSAFGKGCAASVWCAHAHAALH